MLYVEAQIFTPDAADGCFPEKTALVPPFVRARPW